VIPHITNESKPHTCHPLFKSFIAAAAVQKREKTTK